MIGLTMALLIVLPLLMCLVSFSFGQPLLSRKDMTSKNKDILLLVDTIKEWEISRHEDQKQVVNMIANCSRKMDEVIEKGNEKFEKTYKASMDYFANITLRMDAQNGVLENITRSLQIQMEKFGDIENQYAEQATLLENVTVILTNLTETFRIECLANRTVQQSCPVKNKTKAEVCKEKKDYEFLSSKDMQVCLKFVYGIKDLNVTLFENACLRDGSSLLRIESSDKHQMIKNYLSTLSFSDPQIIIQGNDIGSESTWKFDDGTVMTYLPWDSGQPNSAGGDQDHIGMKKSYSNYKWGDIWKFRTNLESAYICERTI